jgi:hypothetical protein
MVLELRLGVERLRRRGGERGGRGRRRGASAKAGQNGAGDDGAKAFGHQRGLLIIRRARVHVASSGAVSQKSAISTTLNPACRKIAQRPQTGRRCGPFERSGAALTPAPPRDG